MESSSGNEKKVGEAKNDADAQEEVIDENMMDDLADEMEEKLNLTAGERTKEDDLDPEMDKYFENFMQKLQQDPEGGAAFKGMADMMKGMFSGMGDEEEEGGEGPGNPDSQKFDNMTDMLLEQFMEKDILYEPLISAKTEIETNIKKDTVEEKDKKQMEAQLDLINKLIHTFDTDPTNKPVLIGLFEEMNKVGSFFDIISKYSPKDNNKPTAFGDLNNMFGGGSNPLGGAGGKEECTLI